MVPYGNKRDESVCMDIVWNGNSKKPNLKSYCEANPTLFSIDGITALFSRTRFIDIYTNLCLRSPSEKPPSTKDRIFKIAPVISEIISQSNKYYKPEREITIDESMISFRGRCSLVQYMPAKPVKYGLKAFLLCEAKTGYVLKWRLYTGDPMDSDQNYGLTYKVLRDLCKDFQGKGNILFTDRYYTSLQAYSDLKKLGIGACGTIQLDRSKLPKEFVKQIKSLKSEEIFYFKSVNNLLLSCWKDSNSVVVLSSCFGTGTSQRTRRKKRKEIEKERKKKRKQKRERNVESDNEEEEKDDESDNEGDDSEGEEDEDEEDDSEGEEDEEISVEVIKDVNIPMAIDQYNQYMAGVDIFDQKAVYYGIQLRSHRWYVKIFFIYLKLA